MPTLQFRALRLPWVDHLRHLGNLNLQPSLTGTTIQVLLALHPPPPAWAEEDDRCDLAPAPRFRVSLARLGVLLEVGLDECRDEVR